MGIQCLRAIEARRARRCLLREALHEASKLGAGVELGLREFAQDQQHQGWLDLPILAQGEKPLARGVHQPGRTHLPALDGEAGELERLADHDGVGRDELLVRAFPASLGHKQVDKVEHGLGLRLEELEGGLRVRPQTLRDDIGRHELAETCECGAVRHGGESQTSTLGHSTDRTAGQRLPAAFGLLALGHGRRQAAGPEVRHQLQARARRGCLLSPRLPRPQPARRPSPGVGPAQEQTQGRVLLCPPVTHRRFPTPPSRPREGRYAR